MRMVARNPVSSSTVTQLLMMENQWICARARRAAVTPGQGAPRPRAALLWWFPARFDAPTLLPTLLPGQQCRRCDRTALVVRSSSGRKRALCALFLEIALSSKTRPAAVPAQAGAPSPAGRRLARRHSQHAGTRDMRSSCLRAWRAATAARRQRGHPGRLHRRIGPP